MSDDTAYVAICHACGLWDSATINDSEHPERWVKIVAGWTRRKVPPAIQLVSVESVRNGDHCHCWERKRKDGGG